MAMFSVYFAPTYSPQMSISTSKLNLASGLANTPPNFHRYQEGGSIGGPIKKDKLFFFGDYEDTQQIEFEGIDYFTVPTSAEKTGDFSAMSFNIYNPTLPDNRRWNQAAICGKRHPQPEPHRSVVSVEDAEVQPPQSFHLRFGDN